MANNVLITGASGYLGGSFLAAWAQSNVQNYQTLYALVRSDDQADKVKTLYGAEPVRSEITEESIRKLVLEKQINVVFYLIDAYFAKRQVAFIKALEELKKTTGQEVHFVHTSGAKMVSDMAGVKMDGPLYDNRDDIYEIHKSQKPKHWELEEAVRTNCTVVDAGEKHNIRTYLFFPCIVYGKGAGFGNVISIQTVDTVIAAQGAGGVYRPGRPGKTWPVCHIEDNTSLYISLAKAILNGSNPDCGKHGVYLASSGSVGWDDIYSAMAKALAKRGVIKDATVKYATDDALQAMANALNVQKPSVAVKIGGQCNFTAVHGKDLGWQPKYAPAHILEALDDEVALILENLSKKHRGIR
ncbi:uncharacterized protein J3D65DRAFT_581127 [Phyllosticta citribraziliensis]|uniref:NmrA-like domain-containing protein n=1 Tax=Phyllosticta citribraziliensis TaxID=989973 RepID=A0ABR1M8D5_9PEZI